MTSPETRDQILAAAGEVFADKGFTAATVREICHRAGVNLASVNYHFGDKESLYVEAVKHARNSRERMAPLPKMGPEVPPERRVATFISTILCRMLDDQTSPWQFRLIAREIMDPTRACQEIVEEAFKPQFNVVLEAIRQLLPARAPIHVVRQLGFSLIGQCFYYRLHRGVLPMMVPEEELAAHYQTEQLAEQITTVTLGGIRAVAEKLGGEAVVGGSPSEQALPSHASAEVPEDVSHEADTNVV